MVKSLFKGRPWEGSKATLNKLYLPIPKESAWSGVFYIDCPLAKLKFDHCLTLRDFPSLYVFTFTIQARKWADVIAESAGVIIERFKVEFDHCVVSFCCRLMI